MADRHHPTRLNRQDAHIRRAIVARIATEGDSVTGAVDSDGFADRSVLSR